MIKLIATDWDGVWADSFRESHRLALTAQTKMGRGRTPLESDFRNIQNLTFPAIGERIGLRGGEVTEFTNLIFKEQSGSRRTPRLFDGARDGLDNLRWIAPVAVVTASAEAVVNRSLKKESASGLVHRILDGTTGETKRERILRSARDLGIQPEEVIFIGDAASDIRAGKEAGVRFTIAVTWGFQSYETLRAENPDFIVSSPSELAHLLRDLHNRGRPVWSPHPSSRHENRLYEAFIELEMYLSPSRLRFAPELFVRPPGLIPQRTFDVCSGTKNEWLDNLITDLNISLQSAMKHKWPYSTVQEALSHCLNRAGISYSDLHDISWPWVRHSEF
jgi:phosphoglycolate phosphatase